MIDTKYILKIAKDAFRHDQGYPERRLIHPHREWLLGMCMFTVMLLGGSVAAGVLFLHYQNIELDITASEQRIPTYQAAAVTDVLEIYGTREHDFQIMRDDVRVSPTATTSDATATTTEAVDINHESIPNPNVDDGVNLDTTSPADTNATISSEQIL